MIVSLFLLINFVMPGISSEVQAVTNEEKAKSLPVINALITRLERGTWTDDEKPCLRITLDMLRGVHNNTLWATWVWDSMQPPAGTLYGSRHHLGNFDQCLQIPWLSTHPDLRTQYCIVDVKSQAAAETRELDPFNSADEYLRTQTKDGRFFNELSFSVCLPAVCSPSSVAKISRQLHQLTHLPDGDIHVDPRDCQKAGEMMEYSRGFYVFCTLMGLLLVTVAVSTFSNNDTNHSFLDTIQKSFCMKKNYKSLFKINNNEIKVINGMRVITAVVIVFVHEGFFAAQCPLVNALDLDKILTNTNFGLAMTHLEVVVDTFFAMSGLLLIRSLMTGKQKNILRLLLKRYIRLIGPLALSTLFVTTTFMYMDGGPFWMRLQRDEVDVCLDHWWKNILMINNDVETLCHLVSWYVSCDFQLAILATFIFYLCRWNKKLGAAAFLAVAALVTLNLGLIVYWKKLSAVPYNLNVFLKLRKYTDVNYTYLTSYGRAGSYLVGMVMGYIVTEYNPSRYRNVISKEWSLIATIASLSTMTIVLCLGIIFARRPYNPLEAAVVSATNRIFWAVAVCCIIGVCEYGSVPLVTNILSWSGFGPLSKLCYGLYLFHPFILQKKLYSARNLVTFGMYSVIVNSPGVVIIGFAVSFILYLMIEAPLINMSNVFLAENPKSMEQDSIKEATRTNGANYKNGQAKLKIS